MKADQQAALFGLEEWLVHEQKPAKCIRMQRGSCGCCCRVLRCAGRCSRADSSKPNELQGLDEKELSELVAKKRRAVNSTADSSSIEATEAYLEKHGAVT